MCKELCEQSDDGSMQSCHDCGILICFDCEAGDDVIRPAAVTASGDVYCDRHARQHDQAEEEEKDDYDYGDPFESDPTYDANDGTEGSG